MAKRGFSLLILAIFLVSVVSVTAITRIDMERNSLYGGDFRTSLIVKFDLKNDKRTVSDDICDWKNWESFEEAVTIEEETAFGSGEYNIISDFDKCNPPRIDRKGMCTNTDFSLEGKKEKDAQFQDTCLSRIEVGKCWYNRLQSRYALVKCPDDLPYCDDGRCSASVSNTQEWTNLPEFFDNSYLKYNEKSAIIEGPLFFYKKEPDGGIRNQWYLGPFLYSFGLSNVFVKGICYSSDIPFGRYDKLVEDKCLSPTSVGECYYDKATREGKHKEHNCPGGRWCIYGRCVWDLSSEDDTDMDSIPDFWEDDGCVAAPIGAVQSDPDLPSYGCSFEQMDSDADTVMDNEDACPKSLPGEIVYLPEETDDPFLIGCGKEKIDPDVSKEVCESREFSWVGDETDGQCCGDDEFEYFEKYISGADYEFHACINGLAVGETGPGGKNYIEDIGFQIGTEENPMPARESFSFDPNIIIKSSGKLFGFSGEINVIELTEGNMATIEAFGESIEVKNTNDKFIGFEIEKSFSGTSSIKIKQVAATGRVQLKNLRFYTPLDTIILHNQGEFYTCNAEGIIKNKLDSVVPSGFIENNNDYCDEVGGYYCSYSKEWKLAEELHNTTREVPSEALEYYSFIQTEECCPENSCWDGTNCVSAGESLPMGELTFVCVESGEWEKAEVKKDQYGNLGEACGLSECWWKLESDPDVDDGECVADAKIMEEDYYCNFGDWTSRTNMLAKVLIGATPDDEYSIYCGEPDNVLIDTTHTTEYAGDVGQYMDSIDNVCVLEYRTHKLTTGVIGLITDMLNKNIIFGATLNTELDDSVIKTFGQEMFADYCKGVIEEDEPEFLGCDQENVKEEAMVWYNKKTNTLLYSPKEFKLKKNLITRIINWVTGEKQNILNDFDFLNQSGTANTIYLNRDDDREIKGVKNRDGRSAVLYRNIYEDVCGLFSEQIEKDDVECIETYDKNTITRLARDKNPEGDVFKNFKDLTSKIRLGEKVDIPPPFYDNVEILIADINGRMIELNEELNAEEIYFFGLGKEIIENPKWPERKINRVSWNFGNKNITFGVDLPVYPHSYDTSGTYTITVITTDNKNGIPSIAEREIEVVGEEAVDVPTGCRIIERELGGFEDYSCNEICDENGFITCTEALISGTEIGCDKVRQGPGKLTCTCCP